MIFAITIYLVSYVQAPGCENMIILVRFFALIMALIQDILLIRLLLKIL